MWIDKPPTTANGVLGDRWVGFTIKITQPDGTTKTLGPFQSDDAGGYTAYFTPTQLGNYSAVFNFPGETLTGSQGNPGFPNPSSTAIGDVFSAATSATEYFTVTNTPASTIPENPLPSGYWQNPVEAFNHNWYVIDGNWLGLGCVEFANTGDYQWYGNYNPYTTAPLTAHLLWTSPLVPGSPGGQMGGEFGSSEQGNYYSGFQYQPKFAPIVINGVLYYEAIPNYSTAGTVQGWVARDLRTGQILWTKNYLNFFAQGSNDILMCGQVYVYKTMNTYGGQTYLWATRSTAGINYLDMFDAATGNYILSVNGSGTGGAFGRGDFEGTDGSLIQIYINSTGSAQSISCWNSSQCINPTNSQFWGPTQNQVVPYNQGIMWSTPLPTTYQGNPIGASFVFDNTGHSCYDPDNNIMIVGAGHGQYAIYGFNTGWILEAAYNTLTGAQVWIKNQTETPWATTMMIPGANSGVYAEYTKSTLVWNGYSTLTGAHVWGPTTPYENPLGYYDQTSAVAANDALYTWTFGGWVYCYNMTNGNLIWSWNDGSAGENTPYGVNPLWIIGDFEASLANGVLFVETGHDYGPPLFSGAQLYAINATTGTLIWSILNFDSGSCPAVVDGCLLAFSGYDNQIYCYGKGLTGTTVTTAPVINSPTEVQITGTVTDQGPGNTCLGIPAKGTQAIADPYMSQWMEYLYEQSPEPMNATGVPVTLTDIDPNNNVNTIGTTTSDINGQFEYTFAPPVPGTYTVIATFGGSDSYYSSSGETHVTILSAPSTATPATTTAPLTASEQYFVPAIVGIVLVIIIGFAVMAMLLVRKRP